MKEKLSRESLSRDCLLNPQLSHQLKWSSIIINHHNTPGSKEIRFNPELFFEEFEDEEGIL